MLLADLVDLEWLLRDGPESAGLDRDRERSLVRKIAADREIDLSNARAHVDADPELRAAIAGGWLEALRRTRDDLPGSRVAHALDITGWILVAAGLLLGGGAAKAFLSYDGTVPVNVLHFATFFFGLQIALLIAMLVAVARARHRGGNHPGPSLLHRPIAALASRFFGPGGQAVAEAMRAMRTRRSLYADVERWTLFALAQRFGVAFNVGALIVGFGLIAFSDLVFSWSTTLDLDPKTVATGVRGLALPWWWLPEAVPTLDVVEATQWSRMTKSFVGETPPAEAVALAARWWSFTIAGLVAWGLVPRVLALIAGSYRARRARSAASLDHAGYQQLFDRLLPPSIGWEGPAPSDVVGTAPRDGLGPQTSHPPTAPGAPTWVVVWGSLARSRDIVASHVGRRLSADIRGVSTAGGADLAADAQAAQALQKAGATRVVLVAAAGQQPTADVLEFTASLRSAIGSARPLIIGLVEIRPSGFIADADADERAAWRRALGTLDDAHLWVEAMELPA